MTKKQAQSSFRLTTSPKGTALRVCTFAALYADIHTAKDPISRILDTYIYDVSDLVSPGLFNAPAHTLAAGPHASRRPTYTLPTFSELQVRLHISTYCSQRSGHTTPAPPARPAVCRYCPQRVLPHRGPFSQ